MLFPVIDSFLWTPYRRPQISGLITIDMTVVSRTVVALICFATDEFHQADRVMRQFGYRQSIPHDPCNLDEVHKEDMRGRSDRYWSQYHQRWITMWNDRQSRLIKGVPFHGNDHLHDEST